MAPDGLTFYPTSIGTGHTTAVDITNPRAARAALGRASTTRTACRSPTTATAATSPPATGSIIVDLSEVQARKPDPQVREISRLTWSNMTIPQVAIPVTIKGKPYLVEVDEYSDGRRGRRRRPATARASAPRGSSTSPTRRKPRVVSNIRLAGPPAREPRGDRRRLRARRTRSQGYAAHYCNVPQRVEPGIIACSMILSGLRVFDIRDPENPKEIAYHVAPPSTISATGGPVIDERANWAMSQPAFAPERGEIWYSDGTSGFYALKMDPRVWPFQEARGVAPAAPTPRASCRRARGRHGARRAAALRAARRAARPRRRVPRLARPHASSASTSWRASRTARGSFTWTAGARAGPRPRTSSGSGCCKDGRASTTQRRVVLARDARGRLRRRPAAPPPRELQPAARVQARAPGVRRPAAHAAARLAYRLAAPRAT